MRVRDSNLGEISPGVMQAAIPELPPTAGLTAMSYFWLAVSAGITVWFVTNALDRAMRGSRR